jgi:hypothetical protein
MPTIPGKPLFDDDDEERTQASQPGDLPPGFGDDDDEATEILKPEPNEPPAPPKR